MPNSLFPWMRMHLNCACASLTECQRQEKALPVGMWNEIVLWIAENVSRMRWWVERAVWHELTVWLFPGSAADTRHALVRLAQCKYRPYSLACASHDAPRAAVYHYFPGSRRFSTDCPQTRGRRTSELFTHASYLATGRPGRPVLPVSVGLGYWGLTEQIWVPIERRERPQPIRQARSRPPGPVVSASSVQPHGDGAAAAKRSQRVQPALRHARQHGARAVAWVPHRTLHPHALHDKPHRPLELADPPVFPPSATLFASVFFFFTVLGVRVDRPITCVVGCRWVRVLARRGRQRVAGGRHPRVRHQPAEAALLSALTRREAPAPLHRLLSAAPRHIPYKPFLRRILDSTALHVAYLF